jgi:hypothetical protein
MGHRYIPGTPPGTPPSPRDPMDDGEALSEEVMDSFIDAFDNRDIPEMIRQVRIYPRLLEEPFKPRYHRICASAIVLAVAIQNDDMVEALAVFFIDEGIDPTHVNDIDTGLPSSTLLIKAAEYGCCYVMRNSWELIGKEVNAKDCDGYTALTILFKGQTEPMNSFHDNRLTILEILLRNGADMSITDPINGETPLFMACYQHKGDAAMLLLDYGADVDARNNYGATPLVNACMQNNNSVARVLITNGANVNSRSEHYGSPLHAAMIEPNLRCVLWLLEHGANPFALNRFGRTPRENAVFDGYGDDNVCVVLLRRVEDRIILVLEDRELKDRKLAVMMGLHKRLGDTSRLASLDPHMVHQFIVDAGISYYTRLQLSDMSEELAQDIKDSLPLARGTP